MTDAAARTPRRPGNALRGCPRRRPRAHPRPGRRECGRRCRRGCRTTTPNRPAQRPTRSGPSARKALRHRHFRRIAQSPRHPAGPAHCPRTRRPRVSSRIPRRRMTTVPRPSAPGNRERDRCRRHRCLSSAAPRLRRPGSRSTTPSRGIRAAAGRAEPRWPGRGSARTPPEGPHRHWVRRRRRPAHRWRTAGPDRRCSRCARQSDSPAPGRRRRRPGRGRRWPRTARRHSTSTRDFTESPSFPGDVGQVVRRVQTRDGGCRGRVDRPPGGRAAAPLVRCSHILPLRLHTQTVRGRRPAVAEWNSAFSVAAGAR